jgi:hypothetical protein
LSKAAATELSTPPLIATTILAMIVPLVVPAGQPGPACSVLDLVRFIKAMREKREVFSLVDESPDPLLSPREDPLTQNALPEGR